MKELNKKYILRNEREIKKFLEKNLNLIPIILLIADNVGKFFKFICLRLRYRSNPENVMDEWLEIGVVIKNTDDVFNAIELLEKFDNEFMLEIKEDISKLIVDIEF